MINYENNGILIQPGDELPDLRKAKRLYLDFETTSGDDKLDSLNPWRNCGIAGICITADDDPRAWYVPIGHQRHNVSYEQAIKWLAQLINTCEAWVNHNIKYDAHVCLNNNVVPEIKCQLIDTLTLAKIIDSDRILRGGYSLAALSNTWLEEDITYYEHKLRVWLNEAKSKDYGKLPVDLIGEYGCQDVLTTRKLDRYIQAHMPEQCQGVVATEIKLTSALLDMEQVGMPVDEERVKKTTFITLARMLQIEEELHQLTDETIRPHVNDDCYGVLCAKFGLPVLARTEKANNPSFDKAALASYTHHPDVIASKELTQIVNLIMQYRKLHTLHTFFLVPYAELAIDGIIHSNYNQSVRTGRMSCSQPNAQQLSPEAKLLIVPLTGWEFLNLDYSQLEFRLIVHYINNLAAIAAYAADPWTDFHQWVADMCHISRDPAKNVNFCIGFGGGKNRVLTMLAANLELIKEVTAQAKSSDRSFDELCKARARFVYNAYHNTLPELKETSWRVAKALERRGYVFNLYGRHRHLPTKAAFRAFNSIVQASAADMIKEAVVATAPRFNSKVRDMGVSQIACVHDNILFQTQDAKLLQPIVVNIMESPSIKLRVPMKVDAKISSINWKECS